MSDEIPKANRLVPVINGRGASRAENAQGTPSQSHISPSILVYEDETFEVVPSGACWKGHPLSTPPAKFRESIKNHRVHPANNHQSHHADYVELLAEFTLFPQVRAGRADAPGERALVEAPLLPAHVKP